MATLWLDAAARHWCVQPYVSEGPGPDAQGKGSKVGQGYKFSSVASRFKRQLADLMDALHRMEPHYIRCIKPNSRNRCARRQQARTPAR